MDRLLHVIVDGIVVHHLVGQLRVILINFDNFLWTLILLVFIVVGILFVVCN